MEHIEVICPNCGAGFSDSEPCCPYCGTFNAHGAEIEYMRELEDLRENTDDLDDNVRGSLKASFQNNAKRIVLIIALVVAAIVALVVAVNVMNKSDEQQQVSDYQARESFREQYFAEFDSLYESGDDAALSSYVWSLSDEKGFDALFTWKHIGYLEAYNDWEALKSTEAEIQNGTLSIDDYVWAVPVAIHLAYPDKGTRYQTDALTKQEEVRAAPYRAFAKQFLQDTLQMSEDEVLSFIDECIDDQNEIMDDELKRILTARLRELGTI